MTQEINVAGTPTTAPLTAAEPAVKPKMPVSKKVMVLAVHHDLAGEIVITPIDIEHDADDQTNLDLFEKALGMNSVNDYRKNSGAMKKALEALFTLFDHRLYRNRFRTFENFCFSLLGTYRIDDVVAAKTKARVKKLKEVLQEEKV